MQAITVHTLFDITETAVVRSFKMDALPLTTKNGVTVLTEREWRFARQQQSNMEVLLQVMSLRVQLHNIVMHEVKKVSLAKHKFHKSFKGKNNVWGLTFEVEQIDALENEESSIGALCDDCNHVPMLTGLNESIVGSYLNCAEPNIYFTIN